MSALHMDPQMETFYVSLLAYAGLKQDENNGDIVNVDPKFGEYKIDGQYIRLPYHEYLKNPDGRAFLHLLNESFTMPETAMFALYKRRLVCELNIRLIELIMKMIRVGAEPALQQRIRSSRTVELITEMGEVEMEMLDDVLTWMKASRKVNDEGFIFDIFLKKNGEINEVPYAAIGKVNFLGYKELHNALENKDSSGYKVFGRKINKKAIEALIRIFRAIFPDIDTPESYHTGTEFKGFRYLNVLLKTSYQIADRINEIAVMLQEIKEPSLEIEMVVSDMGWTTVLEDLYGMMDRIRMIPNQNNPKHDAQHRLNVKEPEVSAASAAPTRIEHQPPQPSIPSQPVQPVYHPSQQPQQAPQQQPYQQPYQQGAQPPQPTEPLSAEEIVRRGMQQQYQQPPFQQPYTQPGFQGGYPQQQGWVQPQQMPQPYQQQYPAPQQPQYIPPQTQIPIGTMGQDNYGRPMQMTANGWVLIQTQQPMQPQYPQPGYPVQPQGGYVQPAPQMRPPLDPSLAQRRF